MSTVHKFPAKPRRIMGVPVTLTDEEHERMNRFRNHANLWVGYAIILLLGFAGLMVFAGLAIRATVWAMGAM